MVIQQNSRKPLMMDILMSETCWAHKKWNKIASDIKLVFYSSTRYVVDWIFKYFVDKFHLWKVNVYICFYCLLVWPATGRQFPVEFRTIITASKWWMSWFTTFSWFKLKCTIKQSYSWWCKQWWKWFCAHHIRTGGGHHHYSIHLTYPNKAGAWERHRRTFTEK